MFTGLIQTTGEFVRCGLSGGAGKLHIRSAARFGDLKKGESIAVNGACLTLEEFSGAELVFHVLSETFSRTNLGLLAKGGEVNLERALALGDRLGGHLVSGHVDGTGRILSFGKQGADTVLEVAADGELLAGIVPKGSVAVDGISLTVADLGKHSFSICVIPSTWNGTNLRTRGKGAVLNIETDMLGKYVKNLLERTRNAGSSISMERLAEAGFSD